MLQHENNPPQMVRGGDNISRGRAKLKTIDTRRQPLERELEDALVTEIDHLVSLDDIYSLCSMYDGYVAASEALLSIKKQPRAADVEDFIEYERCRLLSKSLLVADRLQDLRPDYYEYNEYCRVLFDCSMRMGNGAVASVAVLQGIPKPPSKT